MRSNVLSKLIFASCVWYSDRAYYGLCVLVEDIGRRLPLQLQCSYQGQQCDVSQSVRGNYKTRSYIEHSPLNAPGYYYIEVSIKYVARGEPRKSLLPGTKSATIK